MKILAVHSRYQRPGGEDVVFDSETALLESRGHEVVRYTTHNRDVTQYSPLTLAAKTIWNTTTWMRVRALIRDARPDVVHVHNTLALISPSVYAAAQSEGVPVVQTLHNFRLVCPGALLLRNGAICEECLGTTTRWPGVLHGCYHDSRPASAVIAAMLTVHSLAGTWTHRIDRYIALSEFARSRFVKGGCPADRLVVKPNFLDVDPGIEGPRGDYALFAGRLSAEKGVATLLEAFRRASNPPVLKIVGDGPLMSRQSDSGVKVEWLGHRSRAEVLALMTHAAMLIVPSESYEASPLTIIEAFAAGCPVVTTRLGTMAEMVTDGVTGLLFEPGDADDLARRVEWAVRHRADMDAIAARGRAEFERKYTADRNYEQLIAIYGDAMRSRGHRAPAEASAFPAASA